MYCIIKYIKLDKKELPVIILNSQDEVLEFDTEVKAEDFKNLDYLNYLILKYYFVIIVLIDFKFITVIFNSYFI
jgi:hypothetical protein